MELTPYYDARKSFYGKAEVKTDGSVATLYSYGTAVAQLEPMEIPALVLLADWDCSQTTLRHVREFLKQNGFRADSKAQIQRDYA